jgi:hypothetical protein
MAAHERTLLPIAAALLLLAWPVRGAGGAAADSQALEESLTRALESGRFADAALLFHYPESFTESELALDRGGVETSLRVLHEELGTPEIGGAVVDSPLLALVGVGGGSADYWQAKPDLGRTQTTIHRVVFSKAGEGWLVVHVFRDLRTSGIQSVLFGFPAHAAGSRSLVATLRKRLATVLVGKSSE